MSEGSWIDADGTHHEGSPPPGFVQGPDGRWLPPRISAPTPPPARPTEPAAATDAAVPVPPVAPTPPVNDQWPDRSAEPAPVAPVTPTPPPVTPPETPLAAGVPTGPPIAEPGQPGVPFEAAPAATAPFTPGADLASLAEAQADDGSDRNPLLVLGGLTLAAFVLIGGLVAFLLGRDDGQSVATDATTTSADADAAGTDGDDDTNSDDATDDEPIPTTTRPSELSTTTSTTDPDDAIAEAGGATAGAEGITCRRVDESYIELDLVNDGDSLADFVLSVRFDEGDTVIGTESAYVNSVRPGERVVEREFMFEERGSTCEVVEVDRWDYEPDDEFAGDAGPCAVTGTDFAGDLTASTTILHDRDGRLDYVVTVAFVDPDGIRVGEGSGSVAAVRSGEAVPIELFSLVPESDVDVRCEVVSVSGLAVDDTVGPVDGTTHVSACVPVDETLEVTLTNSSDLALDYWITLVTSAGGQRIGDTTVFVSAVPIGVTAIERASTFDPEIDGCEIVAVETFEPFSDDLAEGDTITCAVTGADSFDDVEGVVDVTNNGTATFDYNLTLGFYDTNGVRRGSSGAFIESLAAGDSTSSEFVSFVPFAEGYDCRIELVSRSTS